MPPYSQLVQGIPIEVAGELRTVPALRAGEAIGFFLTAEGDIRQLNCIVATQVEVRQPQAQHRLLSAHGQGQSPLLSEDTQVGRVGGSTGIHSLSHQAATASVREGGRMAVTHQRETVAMRSDSGTIETRGSARLARTQQTGGETWMVDASRATEQHGERGETRMVDASRATERHGERSNTGAVSDAMSVRSLSGSDALATRQSRSAAARMAQPVSRNMAAILKEQTSLATQRSQGSLVSELHNRLLNRMGQSGNIQTLLDEDFLDLIDGSSFRLGYLDEKGEQVPIDEKEWEELQKDIDDWSDLQVVYEEGVELTKFLDGLLTARFRRQWAERVRRPDYQVEPGCVVMPQLLHHGSMAALVFEVRNTGNMPLFDLLWINALPEHAEFISGPRDASPYAVDLNEKTGHILVRAFKPIQPGWTFRTLAVVRLEPWYIDDLEPKPAHPVRSERRSGNRDGQAG